MKKGEEEKRRRRRKKSSIRLVSSDYFKVMFIIHTTYAPIKFATLFEDVVHELQGKFLMCRRYGVRDIGLASDTNSMPNSTSRSGGVTVEPMAVFLCITTESAIFVRVAASTVAANPIGGKGANARCSLTLNPFTNCRILFSSVSINLKQYLANLLNFAVHWATVHGWFLSVRASEALSHQSFAIPRSLKAANITLRASSYLRNSGARNLRNCSNASSAPVAGTRSFLLVAIGVSNNSVILIIKFSITFIKIQSDHPSPTTQKIYGRVAIHIQTRGPQPTTLSLLHQVLTKTLLAPIQVTKYVHPPVLYPTSTQPEDTGYRNILVGTPAYHVLYPLNL
ncbi:hypothetical protein M9H77_17338 [Catharanthus roseus]|uniref:Uncharacterized protein n=1 Tax=Catharanthus roseus TaxID=4058 RepID=A0ACC0B4C2_CATRO|nr:hypothetical protein M9H77_17338 [Catharanthus roseus]